MLTGDVWYTQSYGRNKSYRRDCKKKQKKENEKT